MARNNDTTCSVEDCGRDVRARGMCNRHYENVRRYGYAKPRRDWSVEETLDSVGWDVSPAGCWEWRGTRNEIGYGLMNLVRKGHSDTRVHRLMFERFVAPIPEGLVVRHKCDNPPCCNPAHLELGTQADNVNDMKVRGRHWRHGATECQNGHDITLPSSFRIAKRKGRGPEKVCLACQKARHQRFQEKNIRRRRAA